VRALLIEHLPDEGAGAFADWLGEAGLDLGTHRVHEDGPPPRTLPEGYDALVAMGGVMGVGDADSTHPWLQDEMALLRDAVGKSLPVLGVCLGAQLLAQATGGEVITGRIGPELGVRQVYLAGAAAADPLLSGVGPVAEVVQWHFDEIVTLPPGAILLASSPMYPHQAFRLGERAWGVQFHPEALPSMVARWARADADALRAAEGTDPTSVAESAALAWPRLHATWRPVAARFAAVVQDAAEARRTREVTRP
jgi:GMP synthase-like glutamine amidotransferase